jgi:hypothetical protein
VLLRWGQGPRVWALRLAGMLATGDFRRQAAAAYSGLWRGFALLASAAALQEAQGAWPRGAGSVAAAVVADVKLLLAEARWREGSWAEQLAVSVLLPGSWPAQGSREAGPLCGPCIELVSLAALVCC